ncbi:hypothetical protein [Fluviicola sp.]|jgi:hypothetical protein|uniref:hypothetical protein n=1 Tax=Fluviicola sp. TaxID=1917219 RepID=UPI0028269357|nr:hypothetical protein [Fluviicola sp.]MDR0802514.1 hypothetical protein [Fluviicola sp.]
MKVKQLLIPVLTIALFILNACGGGSKKDYSKEVDEGTFSGNIFTSQALGWTMEFPDNWMITSKSSLESLDERSKAIAGDSTSNMSGIKRTLAFQKNFDNNFQSSWEDFSGDEAQYKRIISNIHKMIYNNYLNQRTTLDSINGTQKIGNILFDTYQIALYDRDNKNFANQLLLTSIVKNKFMTVTIAYNNDADRKKMLDLFKKSAFK